MWGLKRPEKGKLHLRRTLLRGDSERPISKRAIWILVCSSGQARQCRDPGSRAYRKHMINSLKFHMKVSLNKCSETDNIFFVHHVFHSNRNFQHSNAVFVPLYPPSRTYSDLPNKFYSSYLILARNSQRYLIYKHIHTFTVLYSFGIVQFRL